MPFLRVVEPGLQTTIQDRGRFYYQKWGVPVAGAMDEYALRVANHLVGNDENEGCLEITVLGPVIEFLSDGLVAITGADLGAELNGVSYEPWQSFPVSSGDVLRFSGICYGCRTYLAVAGGFDVPRVMGSRSTYLRGAIGGISGRSLCRGDELKTLPARVVAMAKKVPGLYRHTQDNPASVRVVLGPQIDAFTEKGLDTFLENIYKVTYESDRMGCRLEGPKIQHRGGPDIVSDGIAIGSIQVPGNGQPIIMMADRQTVGGYAKIATVITPDLWKLAQAKPGDGIRFIDLTLEEAHQEYKKYEDNIKSLANILKSMP